MQCTPNVDGSCPGHFFCWFSTTSTSVNAFYCCKSSDNVDTGCKRISFKFVIKYYILVCPPQLVPISSENGSQYRYCSPSAPINDAVQGCGKNRHCQFSANLKRYICCGLENEVRLPSMSSYNNRVYYLSPKDTLLALLVNILVLNHITKNFFFCFIVKYLTFDVSGFCCPNYFLDVCPPQPANLVPVELAGNYRQCNPYSRSNTPQACLENSACLYTGTDNGFICCRVYLSSSHGSGTGRALLLVN